MNPIPLSLLPDNAGISDQGALSIGGIEVVELAEEFGTPLFVYDEDHLRARCREAVAQFGEGAVYATKAFLCKAMARLAHQEGMKLDVATGGEYHVAITAGVPPKDLVFHGNNKSVQELTLALTGEVGRLVVDSFDEIDRIEHLVNEGLPVPDVLIRITPGVEAHTHEYIATGQDDSKFGFTLSTGDARTAVERIEASKLINLRGIHMHIGSQVFRTQSYADAFAAINTFAADDRFEEVSIGGGLGVAYVEGEYAPTISEWAETIWRGVEQANLKSKISVEPGRAIVASAAITLYKVGTVKQIPGVRTYVAVDGGMSDNPRPILYGSGYETFLPRATLDHRNREVRLVGKHCESGDVIVQYGHLPDDLVVGDIVATPVTGAYGHSMGSNYNKVLRPAVVFVSDGQSRVVVRRETYDDLLVTDIG